MELSRITKAIVATVPLVVLVVTEAVQALETGAADGTLSTADVVAIVVAALTPLGVYAARNTTRVPAVAERESVVLAGPPTYRP